jgi:hypothetical protein
MNKSTWLTSFILIAFICLNGSVYAQSKADTVIIKTDTLLTSTDTLLKDIDSDTLQTDSNSESLQKDSLIVVPDSSLHHRISPKISQLEAGMSYQSNDVYLGRKDSTVLPYYIPALTYYHKSGLYATASLNYLKNSTASRIDLVTLEGGYIFSTGNYDGQIIASKYFYNSQSTAVTSEIKASLAYQNSYDAGFIKVTFTGTLNVGNKLDFAATPGIEHTFYLLDDKFDFTPTFALSGSTQNYYNDYYKKRRYTVTRKGKPVQTGIASITGTVLNASAFKILAYEPTMPINYKIGKCTINFSPTYSIPVNAANIAVQSVRDDGTIINRTRTEKIENTFWWTLGVSFLF